ncbi:aminotransferase class V-fold PLP-dependent enzyme [Ponticoccus sp. SC2-23]|uniref:aminotransferase class V-fold PLP-dependent enzyme n=1 Tax=Alexandriicola marinus TaxID=2081710 RepID=UPI000FDABB89|nr:aminotransferase class V-fold PLP-dependent enzyme [Alexandriicola marinus]MBM1219878.1 aminotransferase class V-fold PLP-dependent enzyme [Ponticoccus sp. SC6-9]MBM1224564.1 aminotransferase class V-fold PLP-dependent enzyme [Ponticoccus sp. SC6-15]MBM1228077.1 aminotransferase class V-fold PLP-dependent enzyme [Ponticoccus sp. SC6-38]MBM1234285.1 aminotransferase class V-fold PLP-dependent enzyme [Ponticoccus sp. SC6-45]MBM1238579.1 aminotransferase class V-fold PLP-dependent enzyme [Pont
MLDDTLLDDVRDRFAHVDHCPVQGPRIFFENAGGALTLKTAVETSARYAAIPDNQGRANPGSLALVDTIARARADLAEFMNAPGGQFFVGESGTELLFRLIMNACLGTAEGGVVLGSTLEHPATRSACARWSRIARQSHVLIPHDDATGTVTAEAYAAAVTPDTVVATILHASPVTGMGVDVAACAAAIRKVAPDCVIIVDGIQNAAHGGIDLTSYDVDGYVISPYKAFSRHGFGLAWISDRLTALPHNALDGGPEDNWEMGTRDTGAYATMIDVVDYMDWLGGALGGGPDRPAKFRAASEAIHAHETALTDAMIHGTGNLPGLAQLPGVTIIGGADNPARRGLVGFVHDGTPSVDIVERLNAAGIRTHLRKADHYSGNILDPLGFDSCIRVSMCHYNSLAEVRQFLTVMQDIVGS